MNDIVSFEGVNYSQQFLMLGGVEFLSFSNFCMAIFLDLHFCVIYGTI